MKRYVTLSLLGLCMICPPADAQLTGTLEFELALDSSTYFDDCDPGTACLVVWCGAIEGSMTFEYAGFDGTYDNYDVTVAWPIHISFCPADPTVAPTDFTGSGTFQIDREPTPNQRLLVDLMRPFGPDITIDSGFVSPPTAFPEFSDFAAFSLPTAESFSITASLVAGTTFVRGDANVDGAFDIADPVFTLTTLFVSGSDSPPCDDSVDSNDDGGVDISDAVYSLSALFQSSAPQPPAPFPACGLDPTVDSLLCGSFTACP